jgi:X-X-X-Leu-X-X-Gly heptad repeat protein
MADAEENLDPGLKDKLSKQGEEALGRIAEELATNPLVAGALARAFGAREKAVQAQEAAMGALGIPSAADIERLTRRLRSVSQRLESIEDGVDELNERLQDLTSGVNKAASASADAPAGPDPAVIERLEEISREIAALREAVAPGVEVPPRAQERLKVK